MSTLLQVAINTLLIDARSTATYSTTTTITFQAKLGRQQAAARISLASSKRGRYGG
jgi:hypothetical protein